MGVWEVRRVVRRERCRSNGASGESLVGRGGGWGTAKSASSGTRAGQSVRDKLGKGGGEEVNRCESIIWTGTWSEPVERSGISHVWQKGRNEGEAKERSRTDGRPEPPKGKRVLKLG